MLARNIRAGQKVCIASHSPSPCRGLVGEVVGLPKTRVTNHCLAFMVKLEASPTDNPIWVFRADELDPIA